jgi:transcriptional regulator with XRE-family HTH domain
MVLIHEKITALLDQRRLKKRDLARALGVSPQTATDICKGRSAITLPHLRNLITFFDIRAEFWLDDERLSPGDVDQVANRVAAGAMESSGLLGAADPSRLLGCLRTFANDQREAFEARFPELSDAERGMLRVAAAPAAAPTIEPAASQPAAAEPAQAAES